MARRSGLGRGLGALIPAEASREQGSALREVPIGALRPSALQPRQQFDEAAMAALAASIRDVGVLQPVLVREREGGYELIAGERRWRAAKRAGLQTMPVLVQSTVDDMQSLEQALVENLHRQDLNALEEAAAYQQLIDEFGMTHDRVAKRVGRSRTAVTNTLRLLQLPAGVQRALADGAISAGHARALLASPDRALQERLVARIVAEGLPVRAVEDLIRQSEEQDDLGAPGEGGGSAPATGDAGSGPHAPPQPPSGGSRPPAALPEPGFVELEGLLANYLDTRVKVEMHQRRGRVQIEFATLEDLERIYRLMVGGMSSSEE
jgi:ParB family transcriptional regulator, chromosome partitioning protein